MAGTKLPMFGPRPGSRGWIELQKKNKQREIMAKAREARINKKVIQKKGETNAVNS